MTLRRGTFEVGAGHRVIRGDGAHFLCPFRDDSRALGSEVSASPQEHLFKVDATDATTLLRQFGPLLMRRTLEASPKALMRPSR